MEEEAIMKDDMKRKVTVALFVATFLAAIEGTIVSTAMPAITKDLNGIELYSWIISVYLLATVITTPIFGKLADLYGRKNTFMIGAIIFLVGSVLSGMSQSMLQLIIFRAIQGLGAGALITIPYTIIGDLYTFEQRAKLQGWLSSIWGIAGISGPLAGGLFVDYVSWRAIFYMNIPFGIAAIFLLSTSLQEKLEKKKPYIDFPGIVVFSCAMISFLFAISFMETENGSMKGSWLLISLLFAVFVLLLFVFIYIEKKSPEPIIPLELFRNKIISISNLDGFIFSIMMAAVTFYIPLWLQGVFGKSATYSGMMMIPLSIAWPVGSIVVGMIISKIGMKKICMLSGVILVVGCAGLLFVETSSTGLFMIGLFSAICGFGFGLTSTSLTLAVTSAVGWNMRGAAVASNNFIRTLGQTVGITLFGLMLHTGGDGFIVPAVLGASLHNIFMVVTVLAVVIILISSRMPKLTEESETTIKDSAQTNHI